MKGFVESITLFPIVLENEIVPSRRGCPRLADHHESRAILERFAQLAAPVGVQLRIGSEGGARVWVSSRSLRGTVTLRPEP